MKDLLRMNCPYLETYFQFKRSSEREFKRNGVKLEPVINNKKETRVNDPGFLMQCIDPALLRQC